jgi:hypothetical protein
MELYGNGSDGNIIIHMHNIDGTKLFGCANIEHNSFFNAYIIYE